MMSKLSFGLLFGVFSVSFSSFAAVDLGACGPRVGFDVGMAGIVLDFVNQNPFTVSGNKIAINNPNAIVSKDIRSDKEIYKYKVTLQGGATEIRTLEVSKDASGNITMIRRDDLNAQKEAAKNLGYYDPAVENMILPSGLETHYKPGTDKCDVTQAMVLKSLKGKDVSKEVYIDKKYCDAIQDLTKDAGQQKVQQCVDLLDKAQVVFMKRQEELMKEKKTFTQYESGFVGATLKIAACSPTEFNIRMDSLRSMGTYNAYSTPNSANAGSQKANGGYR